MTQGNPSDDQGAPDNTMASRSSRMTGWIGMFLGPATAVALLLLLPHSYTRTRSESTGTGKVADSLSTSLQRKAVGSSDGGSSDVASAAEGNKTVSASENLASASDAVETEVLEFSWAGRVTLAIVAWMGIWWLTEAIHISATSLLPLVLFPLLGAGTISDASAPYAHHLIFLYFAGFILAFSMEKWGLGRRLALLTLKLVGTKTNAMIGGFMIITAVLSAFVSNTATTSMMLPIALSVVALLRQQAASDSSIDESTTNRFATCLLLAIAYSASIGGVMTIIGTPTNAFLITFLRDQIAEEYQREFSFASWLPIGVSLTAAFLPIMFLVLTRFAFPLKSFEVAGGAQLIASELKKLGRLSRGERITLAVFAFVVTLWLTRPLISGIELTLGATVYRPFQFVNDSVIAMIGAISLFMIPVNVARREFTMDWATAERLPWGVLLLFGGGLSLAAAVKRNGVAEFIGSQAEQIGQLPPILTIACVVTAIVFMTELTSNAATTASLVPILAALAPGLGIHPLLLVIPATIASSCAFMLPVATPPNAIVFGSGMITVPQMIRAGFLLNLISVILVTLLAVCVVGPLVL